MAPWLFMTGVALEIVGAILIVVPLLRPIFRKQWEQIAARGWLLLRGGPTEGDMEELAYALLGAVFLAVGFSIQLSGYVVTYADGWLALATLVIVATTLAISILLLAPRLGRWLLRNAQEHDVSAKAEAARAAERESD